MAQVEIIIGPMYSGKTTELIRRCSRYQSIGKNVTVINHSFDTRCDANEISTHSKNTYKAVKTEKLLDLDLLPMPNIIGIDEAQFFPDLLQFVKYCEQFKCVIIIAGLDGDFQRNNFGGIHKCIPLCDSIVKLNAMCCVCNDGTPGCFTKKVDSNDKTLIDIGGKDKFIAVCRKHYF
uniref:thymidine kinase n=1 Tax=viral metagenome TaxID=1070528 RepID=A0A6C0F6R3_9ZZZZ|tara:strand:- start:567 stop:1097 length:531 start_codon:yes stop_codon:yes gene_type:complete